MQALWTSDTQGAGSFVSIQPEYSLLSPTRANFERELQRVVVEYGIGRGALEPAGRRHADRQVPAGPAAARQRARQRECRARFSDQNFDVVGTLKTVAGRHEAKPAQVALAWLLAQPAMTAPIIGANSVEQLQELLGTVDLTLNQDDLNEISWPATGSGREPSWSAERPFHHPFLSETLSNARQRTSSSDIGENGVLAGGGLPAV